MPLQVLSEALNLPDAVIRLCEPGWAFAQTLNLETATGLLMWRSIMVRDDDPIYAPVADLLRRARPEVLVDVEVNDPEVFFGKVQGLVALLHPKGSEREPSPQQRIFTDIFKTWGEPVPIWQIPEKILAKCAHATMK